MAANRGRNLPYVVVLDRGILVYYIAVLFRKGINIGGKKKRKEGITHCNFFVIRDFCSSHDDGCKERKEKVFAF